MPGTGGIGARAIASLAGGILLVALVSVTLVGGPEPTDTDTGADFSFTSPSPSPPPPPIAVTVDDVEVRRTDPARFIGTAAVRHDEDAGRASLQAVLDTVLAIATTQDETTAPPVLAGDPSVTAPTGAALQRIGATQGVHVTPILDLGSRGAFASLVVVGADGSRVELVFADRGGVWELLLAGGVGA